MFLHLSVSHSVHRGIVSLVPCSLWGGISVQRGSPWQRPPPAQSPPPYDKEWAVCILLECILVLFTIHKRSLGQGNIFQKCISVILLRGGLCMMSPPVWLPGAMFIQGRGVSIHGGESVQGVSVGRPPESEKRVVRILLECFLVHNFSSVSCFVAAWFLFVLKSSFRFHLHFPLLN